MHMNLICSNAQHLSASAGRWRVVRLLLLMILFAVVAAPAHAASPAALVEDINLIRDPSLSAAPGGFTTVGQVTYFAAQDSSNGRELWRSDGTAAGTRLVKDIYPGPSDSNPHNLVGVRGVLFFIATEGFQTALWRSDGTAAGTTLVKDTGDANFLTNVDGTLFFTANGGTSGYELWKSDGTPDGTALVKDIRQGRDDAHPLYLTAVGGTLFFTVEDGASGRELWRSDGTAAGTTLVRDIYPGPGSASPGLLTNVNGMLFFSADDGRNGTELWKSDGTADGTVRVQNITPGGGSTVFTDMTPFNGLLVFVVATGPARQLWRSDGTGAGTVLLTSALIRGLEVVNGVLFFAVEDTGAGPALWKSDGTPAGTTLVKQIGPGGTGAIVRKMGQLGGTLFFELGNLLNPNSMDLWKSNGTPNGTLLLRQFPAGNYMDGLVDVNGRLLFSIKDATAGSELWKSDGTAEGTTLLKDIAIEAGSSRPEQLTDVNGTLFFTADDGVSGRELWKSDGAGGAVLVKDILTGNHSSNPSYLTNVNGTLFFTADDAVGGWALLRSDGTANGTTVVSTIAITPQSLLPLRLIDVGGTLFLTDGYGLWSSDGTAAGTAKIKDIDVRHWVNVQGTLFFAGHGSTELWKSDGTAAGTTLVKDLGEIEFCGRFPCRIPVAGWLTDVNGTLFFVGSDAEAGQELWKSDGTAAGTTLVKDIRPGPDGSYPEGLINVGGTLFFAAYNDAAGQELWRSDGTAAGTTLVKDIFAGPGSAFDCFWVEPASLTNASGTLFFAALDSVHGCELWKSDGTAAGTTLVKDIKPGTDSSYPQHLAQVGPDGRVLFAAADDLAGMEMWQTNGAEVGTVRVQDIAPGVANANPSGFTASGPQIFFRADDGASGRELWALSADSLSTPIAYGTRVVVKVETIVSGRLNAVDLEGDTLTYSIVANGAKGTATIVDPANGAFTYTPNPGASGGDSFTFQVSDGQHTSERATVDVTIAATVVYLPGVRR
jgi:ELWxxDGT repeat protein